MTAPRIIVTGTDTDVGKTVFAAALAGAIGGHYWKPVQAGLDIIRGLHGHTTGYAVPTYMIDAPGGGGKVPVTPNYIVKKEGDDLVIRNYAGTLYRYRDPEYAARAVIESSSAQP